MSILFFFLLRYVDRNYKAKQANLSTEIRKLYIYLKKKKLLKLHGHKMMDSRLCLTLPIAPESKMQRCALMHKDWKHFGSGATLNVRSFFTLNRTGWGPFIIFQPADN